MVMPHSALQTGQYSKWRTGAWRSTSGGKGFARILAVRFNYKRAWDLERLEPNTFFPMPASVVFAQRAGMNAKAEPLPQEVERWFDKAGAPSVRREAAAITDTSVRGESPYVGHARQGASIVPRRLFFVREVQSTAVIRAAPTVTVVPRLSSQDNPPYNKIDLTPLTRQAIEEAHLFDVHLGETIVPYATLPPLKALLPLKQSDVELPADGKGVGGIRVDALRERMQRRWRTINRLWEENKRQANSLSLLGRIDYHRELSAQLDWQQNHKGRPVRIVYTSAGEPTAALLDNEHDIVDYKLFWVVCKDTREAHYLLAIINSGTLAEDVNPYTAPNWAGKTRDLQKHLWKLPIPEFDSANSLHAAIADAGIAAAKGARSLLDRLRADRGDDLTSAYARKQIREWLAASDEGRAVEEVVRRLLRG